MDIKLLEDAAIQVYAELGQQSETTYRNALSVELQMRGQGPVTMEVVAPIQHRGCTVGHSRHDIVCKDTIVELKVAKTAPAFDSYIQQCKRYAKSAPGMRVVLIVFGPENAKTMQIC